MWDSELLVLTKGQSQGLREWNVATVRFHAFLYLNNNNTIKPEPLYKLVGKNSVIMVSLGHLHKTKKLFDNRYRLESRLGGGGFSEVWLAYDTKSQNKVALKVYAQVGNLDEDGISMFRNEFSIVCNYNHSNILRPFSFETSNEHP